jgi:hypothetical protein
MWWFSCCFGARFNVLILKQCGQCDAKDLECTSNYIEQLQNKPRRPRKFKDDREKEKDKERESEARRSDDELRVSPPAASGSSTSRASASASASAEEVPQVPTAPAVPLVDE